MPAIRPPRYGVKGLLITTALMSACATRVAPDTEDSPAGTFSRTIPSTSEIVPVIRHGRYTLVNLAPEPAQRDLMRQTIEVSIPPTLDANIGEALRYVLQRSGYRLCETAETAALYALPLPAAHLRLGPLTLREALLTLAGPAWNLSLDEASRQVCFKPAPIDASDTCAEAETWKVRS
jgi:type IV pili sensor histidine kinase/response regulator